MNKCFILFPFILGLLLLGGCQKLFLGDDEIDDPENNFELFWDHLDKHSGIIFSKKIDWVGVYQEFRPQVTDQTSNEELWNIFKEMIEVFDDEHTAIFTEDEQESHASGSHRIGDAINEFSKELIRKKYLESFTEFDPLNIAPDFSYGKIKDKQIGYIYLGDTDGNSPGALMDIVLKSIGNLDAIIFDVRNNGGGLGSFAIGITNGFAEKTRKVFSSQTRNGPSYDDFDEKTFFYNSNDGENQFNKPVIVLTDAFSVSGAEHVTLSLKINSHVTHMGDTTAGAFSSLSNRRFLPNGWTFQYPMQISLTPEGELLDGEGLIPDVLSLNTPQDIKDNRDRVIEDAIQYLFDVYGIE